MKRFVSIALVLLMLLAVSAPALADLGEPSFKDWYVVCGMEGWDYDDEVVNIKTGSFDTVKDHLEPGTRLSVHSYDETSKTYLLVADDKNYKPKGKGFVSVTDAELEKYFVDGTKPLSPDKGKKLTADVNCVVTSDNGVMLRQGPATTFAKYDVVPYNAKVTYRYTYSYGGYNWGYVTYKGQQGWMCIDYTKAEGDIPAPVEEAAPVQPEPTKPAEPVPGGTTPAADVKDAAKPTEAVSNQTAQTSEKAPFMSETGYIILVCFLCVLVVALSAVIILMILKRYKTH